MAKRQGGILGDRAMVHKLYICPVKEVPGVTGAYDIVASTTAEDRDREAIAASAWGSRIGSFLKHPILVSSHNYGDLRKQIGEVSNLTFTNEGMLCRVTYYVNQGNEEADWAAFLASRGKAAYSVGFIPFEWDDGDVSPEGMALGPRRVFTDCELLEISHVVLGSNREALVNGLSKGFGSPELNEYAKSVLETLPVEQAVPGEQVEKEGRVLSAKDHAMFTEVVNDLKWAVKSIGDYLKANAPKEDDEDDEKAPTVVEQLRTARESLVNGLKAEDEIEEGLALRNQLSVSLGESEVQAALSLARRSVTGLTQLNAEELAEALELARTLKVFENKDVEVDAEQVRRLVLEGMKSAFQEGGNDD